MEDLIIPICDHLYVTFDLILENDPWNFHFLCGVTN